MGNTVPLPLQITSREISGIDSLINNGTLPRPDLFYTGYNPEKKYTTDSINEHGDQKDWSWDCLPEILYYLLKPGSPRADIKPLKENGKLVPGYNGRDWMRDVEVLPRYMIKGTTYLEPYLVPKREQGDSSSPPILMLGEVPDASVGLQNSRRRHPGSKHGQWLLQHEFIPLQPRKLRRIWTWMIACSEVAPTKVNKAEEEDREG